MFGDQKLEITFGPWQDILLLIAVFLIIFVYGSAAVNMIINEVQGWFGKNPPEKNGAHTILYEIMWGSSLYFGGDDIQTRISPNIEEATVALVHENGKGFVRYRPFIPGKEFDWGMALWRDTSELMKPIYDNAVAAMRSYAGEDVEKTSEIYVAQSSNLKLKDFEQDEEATTPGPMWVIQWSNNIDFGTTKNGVVHSFITGFLSIKIREILEEHGDGYIRYRDAEAEDNESTWTPNGYVTKEEVTNAKHL